MPRFFYLVPSQTKKRLDGEGRWQHMKRLLFRGNRQLPSGGVKIIYQHCDLLRKNGYEAYPVHLGNFRVDWFSHDVKAVSEKEAIAMVRKTDILVCPEIIPSAAGAFSCKRKVAFIQNWALVEIGTKSDKRYEDYGFAGLLSCSRYIKNYMKNRSQLTCKVVINGIDLNEFHPDPDRRSPESILYLNRRNVADARKAIELFERETGKINHFEELENKYSQQEIISFYQKADVFMAIGYPEGFALPPLEAMACGCAVIGFTGGGGLEHMIDGKSALIAPDGDAPALSHCLKQILNNKGLKEKIRAGGFNKAQEFSLQRMETDLLTFASSFD